MDPTTGLQILPTPKKRASYRPAALRTNSHAKLKTKEASQPAAEVHRTGSKLSRQSTASSSLTTVEVTRDHWTPDSSVTTCGACPLSFSFLERKHHCRRCGGIFCSAHSQYTVTLNHDASFSPTGQNSRACPRCRRDFELWMNPPNIQRPTTTTQTTMSTQMRPQKMNGRYGGTAGTSSSAEDQDDLRGMPAASVPTDWTWSTF